MGPWVALSDATSGTGSRANRLLPLRDDHAVVVSCRKRHDTRGEYADSRTNSELRGRHRSVVLGSVGISDSTRVLPDRQATDTATATTRQIERRKRMVHAVDQAARGYGAGRPHRPSPARPVASDTTSPAAYTPGATGPAVARSAASGIDVTEAISPGEGQLAEAPHDGSARRNGTLTVQRGACSWELTRTTGPPAAGRSASG